MTEIFHKKIVVPSLPAQSFDEILNLCNELEGVSTDMQIDIVDGQFVPPSSWPFTEEDPMSDLLKLNPIAKKFNIEMDCMVMHPEQYLDTFVSIGVKRVIVHMGSTQKYSEIIEHARAYTYTLGFAIMNDTPLSVLQPYIEDISFVQVMGIRTIGKQGQAFDERTLDTVRTLRKAKPSLEIAVDGSVNKDTIELLDAVGVNRFAPGSAVAKQEDPRGAYLELVKLITE